MKIRKSVRYTALMMASCWLAMPHLARATEPFQPFSAAMAGSVQPAAADVALGSGGTLQGQLVDPQGTPLAGTSVHIEQEGQLVATALTNEQGAFQFTGLSGGSYALNSTNCALACRLWAPGTAPPSTQQALLLITGKPLVRGAGCGTIGILGNPWVLGGLTAAAIAVPLALDHDRSS